MSLKINWSGSFCKIQNMVFFFSLLAILPFSSKVFAQKPDTIRTLVLLTDFSDAPGKLDINQVKAVLNSPGFSNTTFPISSRDYWYEVSHNKLVVVFDVIGYYRAPQTAADYRTQSWEAGVTMAAEGFQWIAKTMPTYNWDALSVNQDNRFRGLCIIPSTSIPANGATHYLGDKFMAPNKAKGNRLSIIDIDGGLFGFNHEFGHMVFDWPDLYSITGGRGVGAWDIMAGNNEVPGIPNAVFRASQGWLSLQDIAGVQTITLEENGPRAIRIKNPRDPLEYFIVEARNSSARTTQSPALGRGLLIWHFDENVLGNGNYDVNGERMTLKDHYQVSLEQADGKFDLENGRNGGDSADAFGPGKSFGNNTTPNSKWWDGSSSGLDINSIKWVDGNKISFQVSAPGTTAIQSLWTSKPKTKAWNPRTEFGYIIRGDLNSDHPSKEFKLYQLDGKAIVW